MEVAVCVPQREHRIPVLPLRDLAHSVALHQGIFPVDIIEDIRVYQCMVEPGVEYSLLGIRSALHPDFRQVPFPLCRSTGADRIEVKAFLLRIQVLPGVLRAHERHAHLHLDLLAFFRIETEPVAYVVPGQLAAVTCVKLVFPVVRGPFSLHAGHRPLLFPEA